ncbi:MAG: hypothetical protein SV487_08125, partial [Thermodesulfobacteriota bacterium]|nr:hypothetical protein [Thermodesulfobacteriota bacterium]
LTTAFELEVNLTFVFVQIKPFLPPEKKVSGPAMAQHGRRLGLVPHQGIITPALFVIFALECYIFRIAVARDVAEKQ